MCNVSSFPPLVGSIAIIGSNNERKGRKSNLTIQYMIVDMAYIATRIAFMCVVSHHVRMKRGVYFNTYP